MSLSDTFTVAWLDNDTLMKLCPKAYLAWVLERGKYPYISNLALYYAYDAGTMCSVKECMSDEEFIEFENSDIKKAYNRLVNEVKELTGLDISMADRGEQVNIINSIDHPKTNNSTELETMWDDEFSDTWVAEVYNLEALSKLNAMIVVGEY